MDKKLCVAIKNIIDEFISGIFSLKISKLMEANFFYEEQ